MAVLDQNARSGAMFCHLAGFAPYVVAFPLASIIGPLVVWSMKKDEHGYIDEQGREAVNFHLSALIIEIICIALCFVIIGFPLLIAFELFKLIIMIVAIMRASSGEHHRYPLTIRFV
jgi:uncharacterized Tic20 family protein